MYYKPESLEENFSNVLKLRDNFMNNIKSYMWEYDWICRVYTDANTYNFYLRNYMINPYVNSFDAAMEQLAYKVFGYTLTVFETLSYALDYWRIHTDSKQKNRNVTDKEYDQALKLLSRKKKISNSDKEILLKFRPQRNYCTHYGRIQFCTFIFNHQTILYNLIQVILSLLGQMDINYAVVSEYNLLQGDYIEQIKETLDEFSRDNNCVAFCRVQRTPMRFRADAVQSTTDALKQCIFSYSRGFITTV